MSGTSLDCILKIQCCDCIWYAKGSFFFWQVFTFVGFLHLQNSQTDSAEQLILMNETSLYMPIENAFSNPFSFIYYEKVFRCPELLQEAAQVRWAENSNCQINLRKKNTNKLKEEKCKWQNIVSRKGLTLVFSALGTSDGYAWKFVTFCISGRLSTF